MHRAASNCLAAPLHPPQLCLNIQQRPLHCGARMRADRRGCRPRLACGQLGLQLPLTLCQRGGLLFPTARLALLYLGTEGRHNSTKCSDMQ